MRLSARKARQDLSADSLFRLRGARFDRLADSRAAGVEIPLGDALRSAFAMFSLKDPSLLAFDARRRDSNDNFRTLYGIQRVPCDSQMRSVLDPVDPAELRPLFQDVFRRLQRGKALEPFVYLEGHYRLSLDGTTYFSSSKVHCPACLEKHPRGGGVTDSHQLLGATLVHPDLKEVIPLAPEPIINEDGHTKHDCERHATRRGLQQFRRDHPHLPVIIVEDALSSNAPHLDDLRAARAHDIIGVRAPATTPFCSSDYRPTTRPARRRRSRWSIRPLACYIIFAGTTACHSTSRTRTAWSTCSNPGKCIRPSSSRRSAAKARCSISVGSRTSC